MGSYSTLFLLNMYKRLGSLHWIIFTWNSSWINDRAQINYNSNNLRYWLNLRAWFREYRKLGYFYLLVIFVPPGPNDCLELVSLLRRLVNVDLYKIKHSYVACFLAQALLNDINFGHLGTLILILWSRMPPPGSWYSTRPSCYYIYCFPPTATDSKIMYRWFPKLKGKVYGTLWYQFF